MLSHHTTRVFVIEILSSYRTDNNQSISAVVLAKARYSDFVEDLATAFYFFELKDIRLFPK